MECIVNVDQANAEWTLFCPHEAPGLADCHSQAFDDLYTRYEREGKGRKTVKAQELWFKIVEAQVGLTANSAACQCGSTKCSAAGNACHSSKTCSSTDISCCTICTRCTAGIGCTCTGIKR